MKYSDVFGKKSSRILLGTAYFGDTISERDAFDIMDKFRESGGTHIDTARLYADGASEAIIGKWRLSRCADEMLISTKGGYYDTDKGEAPRINDTEIRLDVERSLKALKQDSIDFYWLHRDDEGVPVEDVILTLNRLAEEGKIKSFGASNWTSERIAAANTFAKSNSLKGFTASQIRFNPAYCVTERSWLVGMTAPEFEFYKKNNMPVVAYSSQAKGFFSKIIEQGEESLSEKAKKRYLCEENLKRAGILKELAEKNNCSVAAIICGAFCSFRTPEVFPVIGGSRLSQIADSLSGMDITICEDDLKRLFQLDI